MCEPRGEVLGVPPAHARSIGELFERIVAGRFEQAVAKLAAGRICMHQGFLDQRQQQIAHLLRWDFGAGNDCRDRCERRGAEEHRKPGEQYLFGIAE